MNEFKFSHYEIECLGKDNIWGFLECCNTLEEAKKLKGELEATDTKDTNIVYRIVELQKRVVVCGD